MYWVTQKLPRIYTANHATFPIRILKITVQICGNFWVTQYIMDTLLMTDLITRLNFSKYASIFGIVNSGGNTKKILLLWYYLFLSFPYYPSFSPNFLSLSIFSFLTFPKAIAAHYSIAKKKLDKMERCFFVCFFILQYVKFIFYVKFALDKSYSSYVSELRSAGSADNVPGVTKAATWGQFIWTEAVFSYNED